jgi:hypothetical protein
MLLDEAIRRSVFEASVFNNADSIRNHRIGAWTTYIGVVGDISD